MKYLNIRGWQRSSLLRGYGYHGLALLSVLFWQHCVLRLARSRKSDSARSSSRRPPALSPCCMRYCTHGVLLIAILHCLCIVLGSADGGKCIHVAGIGWYACMHERSSDLPEYL